MPRPNTQKMGNRFCPTTRHQLPGHHHTVIPQWVLHYCLSCLHWKPRDARHYSSRQGAAFRGSHVILPEDGCLTLCRSWAGQNRATVATPRISQGIHARRWRAVFVTNSGSNPSALSKGWGLDQRSFIARNALSGDTELTAGAANVLFPNSIQYLKELNRFNPPSLNLLLYQRWAGVDSSASRCVQQEFPLHAQLFTEDRQM